MQATANRNWEGIVNLEAISKLSVNEKNEIIEAIEETMVQNKLKEPVYYKDDEEDVRLAQEALDEYLADPSIGMSADDFIAKEIKRLKQKSHANNPTQSPKRYKKASNWYEEQSLDLGPEFVMSVNGYFKKVEKNPEHYKFVNKVVQVCLIKKYPYKLYFSVVQGVVVILRLRHNKQKPLKRFR